MEIVVTTVVKEEDLSSVNLSDFDSFHLVLRQADEDAKIKLEWPSNDGNAQRQLKIVAQEPSETNLHLLASKIASVRNPKST